MASVENRGNGKWTIVVSSGYDAKGKKIRYKKTVKARNEKEAQQLAGKYEEEIQTKGYFKPIKIGMSDFILTEWLPRAKKILQPTTYNRYLDYTHSRIIPAFKSILVHQVKPMHISDFLDNLSENGMRKDNQSGTLSAGTIEYYHRILRNIFKYAVEREYIKESPAAKIKKPKVGQKEVEVYDESETNILFEALNDAEIHWRVFVKMATTTALRRSELLGLEWKHIDMDEGTVSVKQALTYTRESGYHTGETKTKGSKRKVSLPFSIIQDLKKLKHQKNIQKLQAAELWNGGQFDFLFSDWKGKPINPSSVGTWWRRFLKRNKLRHINFHALRHTSATLLINQGVHAKIISTRLGHADIKTTMNIYGHTLEKADREVANIFDNMFNTQKNNVSQ